MTLQAQIKEMLVTAMLSGQLPANATIPSTRVMAKRLNVSRNTVMLAYQALAADGYLEARQRSGFYVSADVRDGIVSGTTHNSRTAAAAPPDWDAKLSMSPADQAHIRRPENWHDYPYPFIYGQSDPSLFPITAWRDCVRQAMSRKWLDAWTDDRYMADDPMLIEQIRQRILTRRGIMARSDEILITLGAQNALYLLAQLLVKPDTSVAIEDPGYLDMRNIFALQSQNMQAIPVDREGIVIDALAGANLVYVTPSHQFPTNVTMSMARRHALLDWAQDNDALLIEDDYEFETNYNGEPTPALKSLDGTGRVLYVGSLSKSLMPGLRMGFLVAPAKLITQLRALRRLMLRHPPGNNQRVVALFLAQGQHDSLIGKLHRSYYPRWQAMSTALENYFPGWTQPSAFGGTSFWLKGPERLDSRELAVRALEVGIIIEPGDIFFSVPEANRHYFRLGFSSIPLERIDRGIELLADVAAQFQARPKRSMSS